MARARLASHDYRYTAGRRRLVDALASAGHPVTLPEIASLAPDLPLSSSYRNLDVLERSGVVSRISIRGDRAHFELAEPLLSHHHHLVCLVCGTVEDIHLDAEVEHLIYLNLLAAAQRAAFTPLRHMLDLHGHCSKCEPPSKDLHADTMLGKNIAYSPALPDGDTTEGETSMGHVHTDECYDHPEHTHADHADHCGMEEHRHADHCDIEEHGHADHADHCAEEGHTHADHADHCDTPEHSHADHCDTPEHSHADHADHCDIEEHIHTEECCIAA